MKRTLIISLIVTLTNVSCLKDIICIQGNGILDEESRTSAGFTGIKNSTMIDVIYKKADSVSIWIKAESNLLPHIVTETFGGELEIRTTPSNKCFDFIHRPVITITSPQLRDVLSSGSGELFADTLSGTDVNMKLTGSGDFSAGIIASDNLSITITGSGDVGIGNATCHTIDLLITGSGDIGIKGNGDSGDFKITGSGDIDSDEFRILAANQIISGSGNIFTFVENSLNATITGSGNIYLIGNPAINQTITGSGRIIRR